MRRGRVWNSGPGGGRGDFRPPGCPNFGQRPPFPRSFFNRPPRLNRPSWPRQRGSPHVRHPGSYPQEQFYDNAGESINLPRPFNSGRGFHLSNQNVYQHTDRTGHLQKPTHESPQSLLGLNVHESPNQVEPGQARRGRPNASYPDKSNSNDNEKLNFERVKSKYHKVVDKDALNTDFQPPFQQEHGSASFQVRKYFEPQQHYNAPNTRFSNPYKIDKKAQSDFSRPPPFANREMREKHDSSERGPRIEVWATKPPGFPPGPPPTYFEGQRPPATDHYVQSTVVAEEAYNKSVGDTVDIIKKRLQDRRDNPTHRHSFDIDENPWVDQDSTKIEPTRSQEHKMSNRHHRNKSEKKCARMKKKIVRALHDSNVKIDKNTLHKLVDDPHSSAKFEYALNSLIQESRNSLNREMRAAAEKSLGGSFQTDRSDNHDTVYEDTFMAQMQGVLDPADIVMLTDIKPMVMAEINKVLQLDEYGHEDERRQRLDSCDSSDPLEVPLDNGPIHIDSDGQWEEEPYCNDDDNTQRKGNPKSSSDLFSRDDYFQQRDQSQIKDSSQHVDFSPPAVMSHDREERQRRDVGPFAQSKDENQSQCQKSSEPAAFNVDSISDEDEYTFAELDKQYHVAVEYNMIEQARRSPDPLLNREAKIRELPIPKYEPNTPDIKKPTTTQEIKAPPNTSEDKEKHKVVESDLPLNKLEETANVLKEELIKLDITENKIENSDQKSKIYVAPETKSKEESNTTQKPPYAAPIKRPADDKFTHRKEKRKKSEDKPEINKKVLNKNIIINVNDCASKKSDKCEAGKSVFNLYFSKSDSEEKSNESSRLLSEAVNISYCDKYVKRKSEKDKTEKDKDVKKEKDIKKEKPDNKKDSTAKIPAKDISPQQHAKAQKSEAKKKLQPIDIFGSLPRKPNASHSSIRNTAPSVPLGPDNLSDPTLAPAVVKKSNVKLQKRTAVGTQTDRAAKLATRTTQTPAKKTVAVGCQTEANVDAERTVKSEDVMERMKHIDMEIQQLLQEKFKLYRTMESGPQEDGLGLAVVNMAADDSRLLDTFTSMSEEELQEIALQGIDANLEPELQSPPRLLPTKKKVGRPLKKKKKVPKVVLKLDRRSISQSSDDEYKVISPSKSDGAIYKKTSRINKSRHRDPGDDEDTSDHAAVKSVKRVTFMEPDSSRIYSAQELERLKLTVRDCCVLLERVDSTVVMPEQKSRTKTKSKPRTKAPRTKSPPRPEAPVGYVERPDSPNVIVERIPTYDDNDECEEVPLEDIPLPLMDFGSVELQDDMLDVSEDIVIGEGAREEVVEGGPARAAEVEAVGCRLYDYTPSGERGSDMVELRAHTDAVVAIETVGSDIVAAALDGNVYHYSSQDGRLLGTLRGSNFALTCLTVVQDKYGTTVYTGCLDSRIRYYDLETGIQKGPECNVLSPIQSMDRAWDTIFVGTRTGFVLQFECKNNLLIPVSSLKFSEQSILALRALKEGPRKVLLIASRSDQVSVKDAQTGLLLRTLEGPRLTVYSLLLDDGKIYCGTNSAHVHVFDFTSGAHCGTHESGKGQVCVRGAGGLVFAGCYDGCVYVYRQSETAPIAQLRGPADMLLALALHHTKVIASYKNKSLYIWKLPAAIVQEMIL